MDAIRQIADAVLYEGYILWPYRKSALKNQRRWTFGGVYPQAHSAIHADDACVMQTQCLVEADGQHSVQVRVRFLHVMERQVAKQGAEGLELVDELTVGEERHLTWQEACERELDSGELTLAELETERRLPLAIDAGSRQEELLDPGGQPAGAVIHSWEGLDGDVGIRSERLGPRLWRLTVKILNTTTWEPGSREQALKHTLCSTHTALHAPQGAFVSLTDPPEELIDAAKACENQGTWPVLVGERDDRRTLLSSPIILEDYPRIAPESPGDLFDGGEIDQMLVLNILSLTEEEKAEMRDSDPRAREILERTESLSPEELLRLHGTIREMSTVVRP